jgi:hypothetical protein
MLTLFSHPTATMPQSVTVLLYQYNELSEEAKEKALQRFADVNVDNEWWESIYEDAERVNLEITGFDLGNSKRISGELLSLNLLDCCKEIRKNHGKQTQTARTAREYVKKYAAAFAQWKQEYLEEGSKDDFSPKEWLVEFYHSGDGESEIVDEFRKALLEDYLVLLDKEYDYQTSREQVEASIEANEYTFDEEGNFL